jgi:hypothetical protein
LTPKTKTIKNVIVPLERGVMLDQVVAVGNKNEVRQLHWFFVDWEQKDR